VNAVFSPSARNKTIKFTGPELLSQREVVEEFETAVGKPLIVTEVPEQVLEVQWKSAQNPFEKTFAGLMLGLAQLNEKEVRSDQLVPQQMLTVHEFARQRAGGSTSESTRH